MIGGGRRRMRHHQAVPCSMVVAVERWSGRHRRRRGGRCFCSASSSAEKRGELGGDPPPPPFPLRSGPCGRQLRKEMVAERWRGEVTSTRPPVLPPPTPRAHTAEPSVSTMHGVVAWRAERMGREGCGGIEIRGRKHARDTAVLGWSRAG